MHPFARNLRNLGKQDGLTRIMSFVERYENLYIFVQQKSRSTSGFSYIEAIFDCYGGISTLPNGYRGCRHLVSVAQLQLILPYSMLGIKNAAAPCMGQPRIRAVYKPWTSP